MANKHRTPWQRLFLSLFGIGITVGIWQWATWHLYSLPEGAISAFTSITTNAFYVIAAMVVFMVTGRLIYEWKNQTVSNIVDQTQHIIEDRKEKIDITNTNINIDAQFQTEELKERYADR